MHTDFELADGEYEFLRTFVYDHSGISLGEEKRQLLYSRLSKRLRKLSLSGFKEYCQLLKAGDKDEVLYFTNAITTNLTSFFRESHHFDYLANTVLPDLMKLKSDSRKIRIWSAGCSTGEEPYSIAMTVKKVVPASWDVKILATDLDSNVVATGHAGVYDLERVEGMDKALLKKWFKKGSGVNKGKAIVNEELKSIVSFRQLNLMKDWPMKGLMDIIFCRNVVIYFDRPTQSVLFNRYAKVMHPDGRLFVGHSESLLKVTDQFDLIGNTVYKKRVTV